MSLSIPSIKSHLSFIPFALLPKGQKQRSEGWAKAKVKVNHTKKALKFNSTKDKTKQSKPFKENQRGKLWLKKKQTLLKDFIRQRKRCGLPQVLCFRPKGVSFFWTYVQWLFKKPHRVIPIKPLAHRIIEPAATLAGFKKLMFNQVKAVDGRLMPAYNRRKHGSSHHLIIHNEFKRLSKTFGYVSKKAMHFWLAEILAACYGKEIRKQTVAFTDKLFLWKQRPIFDNGLNMPSLEPLQKAIGSADRNKSRILVNMHQKPIISLINVIETQTNVLLNKCLYCKGFLHAKQYLNHRKSIIGKPLVFQIKNKKAASNSCNNPVNEAYENGAFPVSWLGPGETFRYR